MIRLAFTRPADRIAESLAAAEALGMTALAAPSLGIVGVTAAEHARTEAVLASGTADFVVIGSATAAEHCVEAFGAERFGSLLASVTAIPIGPGTAAALAAHGIRCDLMPEDDHSSYGIIALIGDAVAGKTVVLIRSDRGSEVMPTELTRRGATVIDLAAYRLEPVGMTPAAKRIIEALDAGGLDAMAFTSPLSASSFVGLLREELGTERADAVLRDTEVAAIGTPTALELARLGHPPAIVPARTTFADLLAAIAARHGLDEGPGTGPDTD